MVRGRCYCGTVQLEVEDDFEYAASCHCSKCRLRTGSAFKPFAGARAERLRVTAGHDALWKLGDAGEGLGSYDCLCRRCGSLLYSLVRDRQYVHIPMGAFIDTPSRKPDHHIYVGSKAPWDEITDGLPQFDELPPP